MTNNSIIGAKIKGEFLWRFVTFKSLNMHSFTHRTNAMHGRETSLRLWILGYLVIGGFSHLLMVPWWLLVI